MWKAVIAVALTVAAAGSSNALEETERLVQQIPMADLIADWQTIDDHHLLVTSAAGQDYVLTLRDGCFALRFAEHIGVSTSNNTIYAGFDYVTVDGHQCPIQTIHAVSRERVEDLTSGA